MKYNDNDLVELQKISYNYSLYRTGDFNLADEVSIKTIGVFLLKSDTIKESNSTGWIIKTSNNLIQSNYSTTKREIQNLKKYHHDLLEKLNINLASETDTKLKETFKEVLQTLDIEEMKTILLYFQCDQKLKIMDPLIDISYDALSKKISRIKRKLKAETFKKLGVIVTKKFVSPQIDFLIINF